MRATQAIRRADRSLQDNRVWALAVAIALGFQAVLIMVHQPWLDEVQAAQIAIEVPDLSTLLGWLRYEGHPPAWYLLLRGLAYLVAPLVTLKVAAGLCAAAALAAVLFASPFKRAERLLLATNHFLLFEYFTVSRSLTLGVAAMIVTVALWRRRGFWLALAALPMCDFLFGAISLGFVALKLRERSLWVPGLAVWAASGLAAAWSVRPAPDVVPAEIPDSLFVDAMHWAATLGDLLVPWQGLLLPRWNEPPMSLVAVPLGIGFLWFAWRQTRRDALHRAIVFALLALTALMTLFVYILFARHLMLIAVTLILLVWRARAGGERPDPAFQLWLVITAACGIATGVMSLAWPFDRSAEAGRFIVAHGLADKHWVTFPMTRSPAVSAAIGIQFERTESRCLQTFVRWDTKTRLGSLAQATRYFREEARLHGRGYLLSEYDLGRVPDDVLQPIGRIARGYGGPPAYFYRIGPGTAEKTVAVPPCAAHRRPFTSLP